MGANDLELFKGDVFVVFGIISCPVEGHFVSQAGLHMTIDGIEAHIRLRISHPRYRYWT